MPDLAGRPEAGARADQHRPGSEREKTAKIAALQAKLGPSHGIGPEADAIANDMVNRWLRDE